MCLEQGLHRRSKCSRNMAGGGEGKRKGWMKGGWKSSLGLAVWRVGCPFCGIRSVLCLFRETWGVAEDWGRLALSMRLVLQSARKRLHLPFCPMKGFVIWPGMGAVPVFPLAFPTVPQLKKLSSGGTEFLHPPPPPALYNLFVPTSLFCNQGGKKEREKLILLPSHLEGSTKNSLPSRDGC